MQTACNTLYRECRSRHFAVAVLSLTVLSVPASIMADGFRNPPEGASSIGGATYRRAHVEDPSAVTLNPANTADATEREFLYSLSIGYAKRELIGPSGVKEDSRDPWAFLPNFFLVWPLEDTRWVAGLGVTVPFGRSSKWDRDVSFAGTSPDFARLGVVNINPTLATRINDELTIAGGISLYYSELKFRQLFPWSVLTGSPADPAGLAEFDSDGFSFGVNGAATWTPGDGHTIALVIRSPFDVDYDGDFSVTAVPAGVAPLGVTSTSDFESEIKYPTIVALGYGYQVNERLQVEFDVEWIEHSRNETIPIDIKNNTVLLPSPTVPQAYDDNWTFGVTVDYIVNDTWTARGGVMHIQTPTPTSTTIPVASEEDQEIISVGATYHGETYSIDLGYAYGVFGGRDVTDNINPAVNGHYDANAHFFAASVGRHF